VAEVQDVVRTAVGGMNLSETVEGRERYPVNLRYPQHFRDSAEALKVLPIVTPMQQRIALADVADIRIDDGPPGIKSENARLNGWTLVDIDGRDLGSYIEEAQRVVAEQVELPAGYSITWAGQYQYMQRAKEKLAYVVPLTLVIIVVLLYLNFRSLASVSLIIGTLPFALIGAFWLLYLLDYNLSVAVGVGIIDLAGVATELSVIMLVFLNVCWSHRQTDCIAQGRQPDRTDLHWAVIEGGALRIRPKAMTATAIIAGLLPIMHGTGTGTEVMSRIAAPMVGGMVSTVVMTLLVVPAVFYLWQGWHLPRPVDSTLGE
jgi:Cu(I)/Ag(I) efflux system membrane protein CusA/SilA